MLEGLVIMATGTGKTTLFDCLESQSEENSLLLPIGKKSSLKQKQLSFSAEDAKVDQYGHSKG